MSLGSPAAGGRVLLERRRDAVDGSPRYDVEVRVEAGTWSTVAAFEGGEGRVSFADWRGDDGAPPGWLVTSAYALLRAVEREARRSGRWARRVHRWRRAKAETPTG